jgi:hypothetical protein
MPVDGEGNHLRELEEGGLAIELAAPFRPYARPDEFSRLRIRLHGEKVFEIRWGQGRRLQGNSLRPWRLGADAARLAGDADRHVACKVNLPYRYFSTKPLSARDVPFDRRTET